jgi:2-phospho-L-lactate guanylyltransferase
VGSNSRVCELAINAGAAYINEKERGLNPAIGISIKWCIKQGADSILVIPADIPLLSPSDIDRIIELAGYTESVAVLSPSENGGTNALYLRPPNLFPVSYGSNSFKRHIGLALGKGIPVKVYHSSSVAFDIDCQSDLQRLLTTLNPTLSKKFVARVLTNNEHRVSFSREKFFVG